MIKLVLTPKFRRAFRKFVRHNRQLQASIEATLLLMQEDVYAPGLDTHKLMGNCWGCGHARVAMIVALCSWLNEIPRRTLR